MAAAPMAMNPARITSASTIPISSSFCWNCRGTANVAMMIVNTKRLSTDSAFSVTYPAKYSPANVPPHSHHTTNPNAIARPMYTDDQIADSLNVGSCGTRTWAKKSNTNSPRMTAHVMNQTEPLMSMTSIIRY